jgi:hypothetical protein
MPGDPKKEEKKNILMLAVIPSSQWQKTQLPILRLRV